MENKLYWLGAALAGGAFLLAILSRGGSGQVVVVGSQVSPTQGGSDIMPLLIAGVSGLTQTAIATTGEVSQQSAKAVVESGGQALGAMGALAVARESTVQHIADTVRDTTLIGLQSAAQTAGVGLAAIMGAAQAGMQSVAQASAAGLAAQVDAAQIAAQSAYQMAGAGLAAQVDAAQTVARLAAVDMATSASVASSGIQASAAVQMAALQQIAALEDIYATERLGTLAETNRHEENMFAAASGLAGLVGQVDIASEQIQAQSANLENQLAAALASQQIQAELARHQSDLAAMLGSQGLANDANLGSLSLLAGIPFTPGNYADLVTGIAASSVPMSQAIAAWAAGIHGNASQAFVAERQIQAAEEGQRLGLIGGIINGIIQAVAAYFTGGASLAAGAAAGAAK